MLERINEFFGIFVGYLAPVLFMEINGFPLIVLILLFGALIFTIYFRFINVRGFRHSIDIIRYIFRYNSSLFYYFRRYAGFNSHQCRSSLYTVTHDWLRNWTYIHSPLVLVENKCLYWNCSYDKLSFYSILF